MNWHPEVQECHILCGMLQAGKVWNVLDLIIKNAIITLVSTPIYVCLPTKIFSITFMEKSWFTMEHNVVHIRKEWILGMNKWKDKPKKKKITCRGREGMGWRIRYSHRFLWMYFVNLTFEFLHNYKQNFGLKIKSNIETNKFKHFSS